MMIIQCSEKNQTIIAINFNCMMTILQTLYFLYVYETHYFCCHFESCVGVIGHLHLSKKKLLNVKEIVQVTFAKKVVGSFSLTLPMWDNQQRSHYPHLIKTV